MISLSRSAFVLILGVALPVYAAKDNPQGKLDSAATYHNYCSVCHGERGDGKSRAQRALNPPPTDFTNPDTASRLSRDHMISTVSNGKPGTAMAGWSSQLSKNEIQGVVDYVRGNFMASAADKGPNRGREIYARTCSVCHGERGNGASWAAANMQRPPVDFTSPKASADLSRERMIAAVSHGRPDTAMPGFATQLSKTDIEVVVDYVRTAFMHSRPTPGISGTYAHGMPADDKLPARPADAPVDTDMTAPMPNGLKGRAARGEAFYLANCATCHGKTGDGRGPRAYFINPKPRNFLHTASRAALNRPALYQAVAKGKIGTEMPAWDKVLDPQEIADISEFVFQRFIRAGKTARMKRGS